MWTLVLLGDARLVSTSLGSIALERKAAGLLAYLAIEGATTRSRLAGLLWPDSDEGQARANLRQTLSRIRKVAPELLDGEDPMRLRGVHVDLLQTKARALLGRLTSFSGEARILPHFDYDDCPEFQLWLRGESEALRRLVGSALEAEVSRRIEAGQVGAALEPTLQLVRLDPYSEEAHRRLIGLHHLRGDHAAAERAYRACCQILEEELGVTPSESTHEMAALGRGARAAASDGTSSEGPPPWTSLPPAGPLQALESTWVSSSADDGLGAVPEAELRRKLVHLSEGATQLVKIAAVAGDAFSPASAAALLGTHPMRLAEPLLELEEAQILEKNRFARDLVEEAVLASVPASLRTHLQEAITTYLAAAPAP